MGGATPSKGRDALAVDAALFMQRVNLEGTADADVGTAVRHHIPGDAFVTLPRCSHLHTQTLLIMMMI